MTITISYKNLMNPNFLSGIRKIVDSDHYKDVKVAYNVSRLSSLLDPELKTFSVLHQKLLSKIRNAKAENPQDPTEADKALLSELEADREKFAEISFTVERHRIKLDDIAEAAIRLRDGTVSRLTPNELASLEPILEEPTQETP